MYYNIKTEKLYSLTEVAKELNIVGMGLQYLCYYLKELKIINEYRTPGKEYVTLGYLEINYGTRNKKSRRLYLKTVVTEKGLRWLVEEIKPMILKLHKQYFGENEN